MGRPKAIQTPQELYKLFEEYKEYVKNNPIITQDYVGRDAVEVKRKHYPPLTIQGFEVFLNLEGVIHNIEAYLSNENDAYSEFRAIIRAIRKEIYTNKYNGAAVNVYNANIIARDLGLADKKELKTRQNIEVKPSDGVDIEDVRGAIDSLE